MLNRGRLRHRITLQRPVYTQNATTGEMVNQWTEVARLWAAIEPLSAKEFIAAQAQQSRVVARIVLAYRPDVDASMRIVHKATIYNIEGILSDKDSGLEYLTLPCSSGVNDG